MSNHVGLVLLVPVMAAKRPLEADLGNGGERLQRFGKGQLHDGGHGFATTI
jgi:hypothetical protein